MKKRKVIIDCDPGIDDCYALLLCLRHLDVQGIVAVGGNTGLVYTEKNARYITELTGKTDIPVYAGYDLPILNRIVRATEVHGSGGLGEVSIPEPKKQLEDKHGVDYLTEYYMGDQAAETALITLGPLTNIAQALLKEPELRNRIPEILCMGGSAFAGNTTSVAEFNIMADPEAAKIVFESGIPIRMVGLNLTRQNRMTAEDVEQFRAEGGKVGAFAADILQFTVGNKKVELCDACAVAWMIDPEIITRSIKCHVDIETAGTYTRGMTVCDWRDYIGMDPKQDLSHVQEREVVQAPLNVEVAMEFDRERFHRLLHETIASYA